MARNHEFDILRFPMRGINVVTPRAAQPEDTVVDLLNVRAFDTLEDRLRGGLRPGVSKYCNTVISSGARIQNISYATAVINAAPNEDYVSVRQTISSAVAGGAIKKFTNTTVTAAATAGARSLSADVPFIYSAELFQKIYYTDGISYKIWDAANNNTTDWTLTTGTLPGTDGTVTPRLIAQWRSRLVLSGLRTDPHNWWMTALGDPLDLNTAPAVTTATQAVAGSVGVVGEVGKIINCLIPYTSDTLILGCDHSIWIMSGDPMDGGRIDMLTDKIGIAWGQPWCKSPDGTLYFFGTDCEVYKFDGGQLKSISEHTIHPLIVDTDLNSTMITMEYNPEEEGVYMFLTEVAQSNKALTFNGSNQYGQVAAGNDVNHAYENHTQGAVSLWLKTSTTATNTAWSYTDDRLTGNYADIQVNAGGNVRFRLFENAGASTNMSLDDDTVNDGAWHHVVIQSNGSAYQAYVDNTAQSLSFSAGSNNGDWFDELTEINLITIGAFERDTVSQYLSGTVDEVLVTDASLNTSEISDLYASGLGLLYANVPATVNTKLVNYWSINENEANDQQSVNLNGSTQYADCADTSDELDPDAGDFSVEGWFRADTSYNGVGLNFRLAQKRGTGGWGSQEGWMICWGGSVNKWGWTHIENTDNSYTQIPGGSGTDYTADGKWHHICLTYDNSTPTLLFYIDGKEQGLGQTTNGSPAGKTCSCDRNFTIGCAWDSAGSQTQHFDGEIAQWAFYKGKILSNSEVQTLYNYGQGLKEDDANRPSGATNQWALDPLGDVGTDLVGTATLTMQNSYTAATALPCGIGGQGADSHGDAGMEYSNSPSSTSGIAAGKLSTNSTHWFYDTRTNGWFKNEFSVNTYNPVAICGLDGDDPNDRVLLIGSDDGFIRYIDTSTATDDGTVFDSYVTLGPIMQPGNETVIAEIQAFTDPDGSDIKYELLNGDTAEEAHESESATFTGEDGTLDAGMSLAHQPRSRGRYQYIKVGTNNATTAWGMEYIKIKKSTVSSNRRRTPTDV